MTNDTTPSSDINVLRAPCAGTIAALVARVAVSLSTGVSQEAFERGA